MVLSFVAGKFFKIMWCLSFGQNPAGFSNGVCNPKHQGGILSAVSKYVAYLVVSLFLWYCKKNSSMSAFIPRVRTSDKCVQVDRSMSALATASQISSALLLMCKGNIALFNECVLLGRLLLKEGVVLAGDSIITKGQVHALVSCLKVSSVSAHDYKFSTGIANSDCLHGLSRADLISYIRDNRRSICAVHR